MQWKPLVDAGFRVLVEHTGSEASRATDSNGDPRVFFTRLPDRVATLRHFRVVAAVMACSLTQVADAVGSGVPVVCLPTLPTHEEVAHMMAARGVATLLRNATESVPDAVSRLLASRYNTWRAGSTLFM